MSGVSKEHIDKILAMSKFSVSKVGEKTCVVVCTLPNGFEITATSACVDPNDFSAVIGADICKLKIKDKLWELEGYRKQTEESLEPTGFKDRVRAEKADLDVKFTKLAEFLGTETFVALPEAEQERLMKQHDAMGTYLFFLGERIAAFEGEKTPDVEPPVLMSAVDANTALRAGKKVKRVGWVGCFLSSPRDCGIELHRVDGGRVGVWTPAKGDSSATDWMIVE